MHQDKCVEIARQAAVDCGERHDYMPATELLAETWTPHRWVVDAMLLAADVPPLGASAAARQLRAAGHRGPIIACGGPDRSIPAGCDAWIPLPPRGSDLARLLSRIGDA